MASAGVMGETVSSGQYSVGREESEEEAVSSIHNPRSTIFDPISSAVLGDLCGLAVNLSARVGAAGPHRPTVVVGHWFFHSKFNILPPLRGNVVFLEAAVGFVRDGSFDQAGREGGIEVVCAEGGAMGELEALHAFQGAQGFCP